MRTLDIAVQGSHFEWKEQPPLSGSRSVLVSGGLLLGCYGVPLRQESRQIAEEFNSARFREYPVQNPRCGLGRQRRHQTIAGQFQELLHRGDLLGRGRLAGR